MQGGLGGGEGGRVITDRPSFPLNLNVRHSKAEFLLAEPNTTRDTRDFETAGEHGAVSLFYTCVAFHSFIYYYYSCSPNNASQQ